MPITYDFTNGDDHYNAKYAGDFRLHFLDGNDWLRVTAGNVTASMGNGDDYVRIDSGQLGVFGQAGSDWFAQYGGILHADGGDGNDRFVLYGGVGTMDGGLGNDRFDIRADGLNVNLFGGAGDDRFVGYGHHVSGTVSGGDGNDGYVGFISGVTLAGGTGDDTYVIDPASQPTIVENAGEGRDTVIVTGGGDYTLGANLENLTARDAPAAGTVDHLYGNGLNNVIRGGSGDDVIDGGDGNDVLIGGAGNDTIVGSGGHNVIVGGPGIDIMMGGDNTFIYWTGDAPYQDSGSQETIGYFDFADRIDVSNIDANTDLPGMQHFTVANDTGTAPGTLYWHMDGNGNVQVLAYTNGDATPDLAITLYGGWGSPGVTNDSFITG